MIGMESAKAFFLETKQIVQYLEGGGNPEILRTSLNMVITGNPGAFTYRAVFACMRACVRCIALACMRASGCRSVRARVRIRVRCTCVCACVCTLVRVRVRVRILVH